MDNIIEGISVHDLKIIDHPKGDIMHGLKSTDVSFASFGEAYFSNVDFKQIKGWKKHSKMVLNLVVPVGKIRFVIFEESDGQFFEIIISRSNYKRLCVQPGLWMAFQGLAKDANVLLNIASIPHDPMEAESKLLKEIRFIWD